MKRPVLIGAAAAVATATVIACVVLLWPSVMRSSEPVVVVTARVEGAQRLESGPAVFQYRASALDDSNCTHSSLATGDNSPNTYAERFPSEQLGPNAVKLAAFPLSKNKCAYVMVNVVPEFRIDGVRATMDGLALKLAWTRPGQYTYYCTLQTENSFGPLPHGPEYQCSTALGNPDADILVHVNIETSRQQADSPLTSAELEHLAMDQDRMRRGPNAESWARMQAARQQEKDRIAARRAGQQSGDTPQGAAPQ